MINERAQRLIKANSLRSPVDHSNLAINALGVLANGSGQTSHSIVDGRPILLKDPVAMASYSKASPQMTAEYQAPKKISFFKSIKSRISRYLSQDFRQVSVESIFQEMRKNPDSLILSVGGGPQRQFDELINLNIDLFPNVDVVADGHELPFHDQTLDGIYCEAVLEHLGDPQTAAKEMFRVLKPGGIIFAGTPFLQSYHGYPHHYHNFTITGHDQLFEKLGFKKIQSGTLVGPGVCMHDMVTRYAQEYFPRMISRIFTQIWLVVGFPLRYADRWILKRPNAHALASVVYFVGQKPS